jgi:hypothetical protein
MSDADGGCQMPRVIKRQVAAACLIPADTSRFHGEVICQFRLSLRRTWTSAERREM